MTVATRKFSASPKRAAAETWSAIVASIAGTNEALSAQLHQIAGVAALVIAERTLSQSPITIIGAGPRLRVYCLYDDDAITAEDQHEDPLSWDIFESEWKLWLPAEEADFDVVSQMLMEKGPRFGVYKAQQSIPGESDKKAVDVTPPQLVVNTKRLKNYV